MVAWSAAVSSSDKAAAGLLASSVCACVYYQQPCQQPCHVSSVLLQPEACKTLSSVWQSCHSRTFPLLSPLARGLLHQLVQGHRHPLVSQVGFDDIVCSVHGDGHRPKAVHLHRHQELSSHGAGQCCTCSATKPVRQAGRRRITCSPSCLRPALGSSSTPCSSAKDSTSCRSVGSAADAPASTTKSAAAMQHNLAAAIQQEALAQLQVSQMGTQASTRRWTWCRRVCALPLQCKRCT